MLITTNYCHILCHYPVYFQKHSTALTAKGESESNRARKSDTQPARREAAEWHFSTKKKQGNENIKLQLEND